MTRGIQYTRRPRTADAKSTQRHVYQLVASRAVVSAVDVIASISDPRRPALVVHIERIDPGRGLLSHVLPQSKPQGLDALTMLQFPRPVFVESCSIAISC